MISPRQSLALAVIFCGIVGEARAVAAEPAGLAAPTRTAAGNDGDATVETWRSAVERGLQILQQGARNYPEHRECFACHHQTLPLLGMRAARRAGVKIDAELLSATVDFTRGAFEAKRDKLREGQGIGGKGLTVGYGLWTLALGETAPDDLTAAMVAYLLKTQAADGGWELHAVRPPAEESRITATVLAAAGLRRYGVDEAGKVSAEAEQAIARAKAFIREAPVRTQEDQVSRLWGATLLGSTADEVGSAREAVLKLQRDDGGWGQLATMDSDAYATGLALYVLQETGSMATDPPLQRGFAFLVQTQQADGSWFVKKRSKPVQQFFDNGDPHGESQFISITATGWATAALARGLPEAGKPEAE